ncbi:MAG TPA: cyclase family protein, partial [Dehalococcoidia bacterium]|nr:cyclase family protein [Dehalococcoidia bacterium]
PAKRVQAAALVREGIVVSCAWPLGYQPTAAGPIPQRHFMLKSGEGEPAEGIGRTNALDAFLIAPHGFTITHLDAPSHTFWRSTPDQPWTMYNGKPSHLVRTVDGALAGSIELAGGGIVSRGVLLDIARLRDVEWLEPDDPIFPEDLEAAEQAQGVRIEPGDILFARTGFPRQVAAVGPRPAAEGACGFQAACLPWLRARDVAVIATDTANDVAPTQYPGLGINGAIHGVGMGALGLWLLDNPTFEELGEVCARLGRWEFQAVIAPLKLQGGTGCPVNPLALF